MASKVHFSKVHRSEDRTITTTMCNRAVSDGDINASQFRTDVTCKLCLRLLRYEDSARAA